ncbi:MAG TPA: DUF937 domain-containing protein [Pirellulaceae bacterium]|nr:DUF937 domain-containing protein [Pirellulaceae bacterium]
MASVLEMVQSQIQGETIAAISQQLGTSHETTKSAVDTALPTVLGLISKQGASEEGSSSLFSLLDASSNKNLLNDVQGFFGGGNASKVESMGGDLLGSLFGGKLDQITGGIGKASGLTSSQAGKLIAMLAPLIMGALAKQKTSDGLDLGKFKDLLGRESQAAEKQSGGLVGQLLDQDGDGQFGVSDVLKMATDKLFGKK